MAEYRIVEVICGPYRDRHLTMSTADADTAISEHWARELNSDYSQLVLTDAEREAALAAAVAWARAQWAAAQALEPQAEGETKQRAMTAEDAGSYKTRGKK